MCFSAPASFIAGTALSAVGVATLHKVKREREIPFAAIPLLFGIQQLIEGFVWISLGQHFWELNSAFSQIYYTFSNIWWPVFIPLAIYFIEPLKKRKRILAIFEGLGLLVGFYFFYFMSLVPISSHVEGHSIVYTHPETYIIPIFILYVLVTCGSCFVSSKKTIRVFGFATLVASLVAYLFYTEALVSVWCFFSALLSYLVYLHFKHR